MLKIFSKYFGVCTFVDDDGFIYLVLPYGKATIWEVFECKPNQSYDMQKIPEELFRIYDHQKGQKRDPIGHGEHLAVVWIDKPGSGPLSNVPQGWYRVKILSREEKTYV